MTVFVHAWVGDCVWKWVTVCVCGGGGATVYVCALGGDCVWG